MAASEVSRDNDYKWDVEKQEAGPQCAMMTNSQLDGTNPEWDSEEEKSHLPFSLYHSKDTGTIQEECSESH